MRKSFILLSAVGLVGCGQHDKSATNAVANAPAATVKPAPYCFFKDSEMKQWTGKVDKHGDVVVSGKAYREDARYKAQLSPATVSGTTAEIAPTIAQNDTGFAAPDNWWQVSQTIPNSKAVTTVNVRCGDKTVATLSVPRKK
jgi:hypothetical protein